jgi:alpha-L-rhamnosidase
MSLGSLRTSALCAAFLLSSAVGALSQAGCKAVNLRCEYLENPLTIDSAYPNLSWRLSDSRRGAMQTGYQVVVASRPEMLRSGSADIWDSGKVPTGTSAHVPYGGPLLASRAKAYWQVRVWDKDGKPSAWSPVAHWEMGLLQPSDWKAQWIGVTADKAAEVPDSLDSGKWIWYPEGNPQQSAPQGTRYFRTTLDIPTGKTIKSAVLLAAVDNSFHAYINGKDAGTGSGWTVAPSVSIANLLKPGRNVIAVSATNTEPGPAGFTAMARVTFTDGSIQRIAANSNWKSSNMRSAGWNNAEFDDSAWKPAMVVASIGDGPWGKIATSGNSLGGPAPLLRKTFTLAKAIKSARVYVTAKGSYRLHLNGRRVGNDILTPDWTDYRKRVNYQGYDVTKLLKQGDNAIGATVGDGWYSSGLGWVLQRNSFGPPPNKLLLQMYVQYTDGTEETILSDGSWKAGEGPIQRSEIYGGETYDARKEQPSWDTTSFNDSGWRTVNVILPAYGRPRAQSGPLVDEFTGSPAQLTAQVSPTIQVSGTVKPKAITQPAPGVYVYDMGQNMVGWTKLKVRGPAGSQVKLRFAEILQADGNIYRDNLRKAEATDTYTLRGEGQETFEPHFTYHGFRYVEVTGFPGKPTLGALAGIVFHTDVPVTGRFSSSSELVNKLVSNIDWGLKGNLTSVPTDCPQRDERLGWMGDAQIIWATASYSRNMASFTHKWMHDVVEAQSPEGGYSDVSPRIIDLSDGAPAWGDAGVIVPYAAYKQYADTRIIEENWEPMRKWVNYIASVNPNYLWLKRRNNDFGDWVPANSETDKNLIATAYWAYDAQLMAEMARAIGKSGEAAEYEQMYRKIRAAFNERFVHEDGTIANGSQTCYALALHMNLLSPERRAQAMKWLVADIEKRNWHLSTGFLGSPYLMLVLSANGRNDVAYRLLLNDTYPSWGYMIKKGATTMWERWNGDTGDPGMNSFNHYAYGAVGEWLYKYVGGITTDPRTPGFRQSIIRPMPDERLTHAECEYDSLYGTIKSAWSRKPGEPFMLNVTIPANTTATVYVPAADKAQVMEGGKEINGDAGITFLRMEDGCAVYGVGAGQYRFTAP